MHATAGMAMEFLRFYSSVSYSHMHTFACIHIHPCKLIYSNACIQTYTHTCIHTHESSTHAYVQPLPTVTMVIRGTYQDSDGQLYVNSGAKVTFEAHCDTPGITYEWRVSPPRDLNNPLVAPFGSSSGWFLLQDSALVPGTKYLVSVHGRSTEGVGFAKAEFMVNYPPVGGSFAACLLVRIFPVFHSICCCGCACVCL
jgi:hypothetical protein